MKRELSVQITAPARIHCGLISVGNSLPINFGGCGLMVHHPPTMVALSWGSGNFMGQAHLEELVDAVIRRCQPLTGIDRCQVDVSIIASPPRHAGFGSGTQLSFALARAMMELAEFEPLAPREMSGLLQRGERSTIGTYGFFRGGFLVDRGKAADEDFSPLDFRIDFPDWPIVIIQFPGLVGLHGLAEIQAFERIVQTTAQQRSTMEHVLRERILPAITRADFDAFSESIYEYGVRSGEYYRDFQGGSFHSEGVARVVAWLRDSGVQGIVQSSWGPTLVAFARCREAAVELQQRLEKTFGDSIQPIITTANNQGASIQLQERMIHA